jgi:hypothetical protein
MPNPIFQGVAAYDSTGIGLLADSSQNLLVSLSNVNGVALGSPTAWGTAASGNVIGVNSELFAGTTALTATGTSLNVNITGGGSGGSQFAMGSTQSSSALGTISLGYDGTNVRGLLSSSTGQLRTISDTGSTTAVTGIVQVAPTGSANTASNPFFTAITDGTNGSAAIKAASTAAVAADKSLVVQVSPNQPTSNFSGTVPGTAPSNTTLVGGIYNSSAPTLTTGQVAPFQFDSNGQLKVAGATGSIQYVDAAAETAGAFSGTAALLFNGTAVKALQGDASNNLLVKVNVALPAGTNVIGHVISDTGSTTAVTGTVAVTTVADSTPGSAPASKGFLVGGTDGTNFRPMNLSTSGTQLVIDAVDAEASSINFFSIATAAAGLSVSALTPVLSIRANSAGKIFRLRGLNAFALNGAAALFQVFRNPTLTGASFSTVTGTNTQADTAATVISAGTIVDSGFVAEQSVRDRDLTVYIAAGAPGDVITLAFTPSSGSSLVAGSFTWSESASPL